MHPGLRAGQTDPTPSRGTFLRDPWSVPAETHAMAPPTCSDTLDRTRTSTTSRDATYPDQPARQLSTEAIYQAIYRTGSEIRRPQRATLLRTGRRYRRRRLAPGHRPRRLVSMVSIDERPDIADRRMPGHWEGDRATRKVAREEW